MFIVRLGTQSELVMLYLFRSMQEKEPRLRNADLGYAGILVLVVV